MAKKPRISPVTEDIADAEQRRVGNLIYGKRNETFQGPAAVLLHVPALAERFEELRDQVIAARLRKDLLQLATLVTARHWSVDYVWTVRARMARDAGIDAEAIEAIRQRRRPHFADAGQEAVYVYVSELLDPSGVSDAAHAGAVAVVGETGLIELTAVVGVYTMLSLTVRAADLPVQKDAQPLPG